MSAQVATDAVEIEALLQDFSDALVAQRARHQLRQGWFAFSSHSIALLLSFIVAPGCATATIFLMTDKNGALVEADNSDPVLAKSNRLQAHWRTANVTRDTSPEIGPQLREAFVASELFASSAIRGRIEDAVIETEIETTPAAATADDVARRPKIRRPIRHTRTPAPRTESASLNTRPFSLFEKLLGLRLL